MSRYATSPKALLLAGMVSLGLTQSTNGTDDISWSAPPPRELDDLSSIMDKTGVYGFIFNSSTIPESAPYATYNWCNMPHVRAQEYPRFNSSYTLEYVEVIHRHHKRTPYAANTFPVETYGWDCSDQGLFYYGAQLPVSSSNTSASTYWSVYNSTSNPLRPSGFPGNCQFPQITTAGLADSYQHGLDLASVYIDLLSFLPTTYDPALTTFRVTSNVITSQVASALLPGLYPTLSSAQVPLLIQPSSIDSLEPSYPCPVSTSLSRNLTTSPRWTTHLALSAGLFSSLDAISAIPPDSTAWHTSWDHYYDNLSARQCHGLSLPCSSSSSSSSCITQQEANTVYRLGQWEYSHLYRAAGRETLLSSSASFGIWLAELADHLRRKAGLRVETEDPDGQRPDGPKVRYRHNVAHDGSVSRLLSVLQVERMVWPGMGAEVVFELFSREGREGRGEREWFVRVLWGGQVLRSSRFGSMDMVELERFLGYIDGLVGKGAGRIRDLCGMQ
ncbi:hypothetical protein CAC42_6615 [Sphaceloma murrayae]|uniref:Uncharacterized protein n=1 Tax=Sphaceloma murrayae TaxID=2082308 RepID=A0A2K1QGT5_9PEZI|nr:hypothetical protein CAC42_6615 [Sphaceloma murrayae]